MTVLMLTSCQWCGVDRPLVNGVRVCSHCDRGCRGSSSCLTCQQVVRSKAGGRGPKTPDNYRPGLDPLI